MRKPSDFTKYPWNSVLQNSESETVARNIMVILTRTGNRFRPLAWEGYKNERLKDDKFSEREEAFFNKVIDYCKSPETASKFSSEWANRD